jgi:hypothetical protein
MALIASERASLQTVTVVRPVTGRLSLTADAALP